MDFNACFKLSALTVGMTFINFSLSSPMAFAESEKMNAAKLAEIVGKPTPSPVVDEAGLIRGPKTDKVSVKEIIFKDQLVIHDKGMSKDGGPMETVPCDAEIGGVTFGFIQLDEKTTAELNCVDDYAGGISIVIKGAKGSAASEKLGEVLGDAGESTETRSWITKKEGHINIQTVTYSSYQDPDAEDTAPVNCEKKAWSIDFDKKSKKFKRKSIALNEKDMKFVPAARVAEKCAL
jgi:hypothetical protein